MDISEKDIIQKLKNGDEPIFQFIFKKYYTGLYYYAKKYLGDKHNAEEVVQNTFLKLWEKRETFTIRKSFSSYLYKTVYNNCLNFLKHQQVKEKYKEYYTQKIRNAEEYYSISQESGQSIYIAKELKSKIDKAIQELPGQCRKIFELSRFEGLKNHEIAEKLEISINTVQKQISIALCKLRSALANYLPLLFIITINLIALICRN
ncbi:ECF RNA polymerase sigma factor SigW [subsurface metagenome]